MNLNLILSAMITGLLITGSALANTDSLKTGPDGLAFYNPPASAKTGAHGNIIWQREIKTTVPNAKAWKILYWSTTQSNQAVPVSGIVVAPANASTGKPRLVVSWAHGTTGIPRQCAPSLVNDPARDAVFYYHPNSDANIDYGVPGLTKMIAAGYVVVATDYNGLGAPGIHEYLVGKTEARNVLDAAIAVQQLPQANAGKEVIAIGWSQGGQASIWSAQISDYLGNQAKLIGAVSLAPVNGLEEIKIMHKTISTGEKLRPVTLAELVMSWYAETVAYPELKLSDVLTPLGIKYFSQAVKTQCSHHMADTLGYFDQYTGPVVRATLLNQSAWIKRYAENTLGNIPTKVPLAVYQGDEDLAIFPAATTDYVKNACKNGAVISYTLYKKTDHIGLSGRAENNFLTWISDRYAGKPAPNNCSENT